MTDPKTVTIRTYSSEAEAQLSLLNLESMGIDAHILKDDCGGAYPQFQVTNGVQLVVSVSDVERAEAILDEAAAEGSPERKKAMTSQKTALWGVFFLGVFAGVFLTAMVFMVLNKDNSPDYDTADFDINDDGKPDEFHYYEKEMLVKIVEDRNYDGQPDAWSFFESDRILRSESDDNFDGNVDGWATYQDQHNFQVQYDNNFDGIADATYYFANGVKQSVDWYPGNAKMIERREIYKHSIKTEAYIDSDNDGQFDLTIFYDAFGKEIKRSPFTK